MLYKLTAALALVAGGADAFSLGGSQQLATTRSLAASHALAVAPRCDMPCAEPDVGGVLMNDVPISGTTLRSMELADAKGARVRAGSLIGEDGKAVVIFLRHLG